jgi:hypothetical protein
VRGRHGGLCAEAMTQLSMCVCGGVTNARAQKEPAGAVKERVWPDEKLQGVVGIVAKWRPGRLYQAEP